jgi:hypothetical protein
MWDDEEQADQQEVYRKRCEAMDEQLVTAVDALSGSEQGCWLKGVLHDWNTFGELGDKQKEEEARLAISRIKLLFQPDVASMAQSLAGRISRIDILDLFYTGLYGRRPNADWRREYEELKAAGNESRSYTDYIDDREGAVRRAGHDWPYTYVDIVDGGSEVTFRVFIKIRLKEAVTDLLEQRESGDVDLGIVFVHGIGTQRRGESLQHSADSMLQWMQGWLHYRRIEWSRCQFHQTWDREPAYLTVADAQIRSGGDDPAHATVSIPLLRERWLLAEAWWADELHVPSRSRQVGWLLLVTPVAVITHLSRMWRWRTAKTNASEDASSRSLARDIVGSVASFVVISLFGTVISLLLQLCVLLTGVVAIFPVKGARALLSLMQATVGDSLSFTESPIARSAIVNRVRNAIEFAAARSKRVVVVAHSQGAAIAHRALRVNPPDKVKLLVTLGAGIDKLEMLQAKGSTRLLFEMLAVTMCAAPLYILYSITIGPTYSTLDAYIVLFFLLVYLSAWRLPQRLSDRSKALSLGGIEWRDFYARSDPVPNGPITLGESNVVKSQVVHNLSSTLQDHTSYWQNRDEFVPALLMAVSEAGLTRLIRSTGQKSKVITAMADRRKQRVFWLRLVRVSFTLTAFLAIGLGWGSLAAIGRNEVAEFIPPLQSWLAGWASRDPSAVLVVLDEAARKDALATWVDLPYQLTGAVAILLTLLCAYAPARWLWQWWNLNAMRRFSIGAKRDRFAGAHSDSGPPASGFAMLVFLVTMVCVQFAPLAITMWLDPARWIIVTMAVTAMVVTIAGGALLTQLLNLNIGIFQLMDRQHVPALRFVLPILVFAGGMWWLAAEVALNGSLLEAFASLAAEASRAVSVANQHPVILLPFTIVLLMAAATIRGAIESIND